VLVCANCGQENPDGFRFCGRCGASLDATGIPPSEERKVVSVLFCDLIGFTARSERADPEDVRAILRTYHERLKKEIERLGGTVEKFIGDAVMAVFGAPTAHEDDAERAVRAGLRILEAITELNEEGPDLGLSVRIGVNTGEAVVTLGARTERGEAMVAGDVVNTAARLEAAALPDSVVVGEATERITRDHIDYQELEPVTVKGKAEPVRLFRALSARGRYGVDVDQRTRSPFIGRAHELETLLRTFARSVDEPGLQLVTITGEPGVGKSRLLWELKNRMDEDATVTVYWRQGRCLPYGEGITFWALGEIVKGLAGVLESDGAEQTGEKLDTALRAFVEDQGEYGWLRARLQPLLGVGSSSGAEASTAAGPAGPADREEAYAAWRRFLESAAARHPLVLVFEDLHWADPALIAFVDHLVDWSTGVPITVICTARPELYERHPGWGGGKRNSATVSLSPLTNAETASLLVGLLEQAVLPAELQSTLLEQAGGNPLYAEEFVRMLLDQGALEVRGRTLKLVHATEDIRLPDSIQALISARLDTLAPERKSLLQDAAVVGKVFWSGAVAFMSGRDDREVREGLHELARKELVRPMRTSSVKDQAEYAFWHALVRDVAYAQIPRGERARRHRLAADWIERMAGERVGDQAELLSHHYEQALELSAAAGTLDQTERKDLERSLVRFLELAGDKASQLDLGTAWNLYRRALEHVEPTDLRRAEILTKGLELAAIAGALPLDDVEAGLREAIETFRQAGDPIKAGTAMRKLASSLRVQGRTQQARELLHQAVDLLEREPPSAALAEVYSAVAGQEMLATASTSFLTWTEKALALGEQFDLKSVVCRGLQFRGIGRATEGDRGGLDDLAEAVRKGLEWGLVPDTGPGYVNFADWTGIYGDPVASLHIYEEGIDYSKNHGATRQVTWAMAETTWRLFDIGRWDQVVERADEIARWEEQHGGQAQPGTIAAIEKLHVLAYRGRHEEASRLEETFLPRTREIGDPQVLWQALMVASVAHLVRGDLEGARSLVMELVEATEGALVRTFWIMPEGQRVLLASGQTETARRIVEEEVAPIPTLLTRKVLARAALAEADGDLVAAVGGYRQAAASWEQGGYVFEQANALLGAGRCLLLLGQPAEASDNVSSARATFVSLRAQPLLAECDDLLGRATALTS
jgi:class 3 adenylate cyclase/tetratricopeptide (TPR) repeat protein